MKKLYIFIFPLVLLFVPISAFAELMCDVPSDPQQKLIKARKYFKMGVVYAKQGDAVKVIEYFECVIKLVPDSANSRYKYAQGLDKLGLYSRAVVEYNVFLAVAPPDHPKIQEVKERIKIISKLKDKPLPKEFTKRNAQKTSLELRKAKEELKRRAEAQRLKELELQKQIEELRKRTSAKDFEKEKQKLIQSFKKNENKKLKELEERIKRLSMLEALASKKLAEAKRLVKLRPRYKDKDTPIRKAGSSSIGIGLLFGVVSVASSIYAYTLYTDIQSDYSYMSENKSKHDIYYWPESETKSKLDTLRTMNKVALYSGITAGVVIVAGSVMYFMGDTKRVLVSGAVETEIKTNNKTSWSILPTLFPNGGGLSFGFKW